MILEQTTHLHLSSSRPAKIKLSGLLVPCLHKIKSRVFRFKLETDANEYYLSMSRPLEKLAKSAEWDEVTVRGELEFRNRVFYVEKLTLSEIEKPNSPSVSLKEQFEVNRLEQIINQQGKLEPEIEYFAS